MPLSASVREYMSSILHTLPRGVTLDHVVNLMSRLHVRHVPLVEDGRVVAVVTPEDVASQLLEEGGPAHVPVETPERPVPAVDPSASVAEAARLMREATVDYVIVGPLTAPSGILSSRDVVRAAEGELSGVSVSSCMDEAPPSVPLDGELAEAARLLVETRVSGGYPARHVIVGVGGLPIGVVSVRDFIYYVGIKGSIEGRVADVMSPHLYYLDPASSLEEAVEEMNERDVGFLPVVYKAKVLGGVYEFTIVKAAAGGSCG
ncbi:MAG: CBS domain-containing protein [Desulfurococcales archaeon]|nr:CBS domain-containing protein [Desulfurococcales archaeon]